MSFRLSVLQSDDISITLRGYNPPRNKTRTINLSVTLPSIFNLSNYINDVYIYLNYFYIIIGNHGGTRTHLNKFCRLAPRLFSLVVLKVPKTIWIFIFSDYLKTSIYFFNFDNGYWSFFSFIENTNCHSIAK